MRDFSAKTKALFKTVNDKELTRRSSIAEKPSLLKTKQQQKQFDEDRFLGKMNDFQLEREVVNLRQIIATLLLPKINEISIAEVGILLFWPCLMST